MSYIYASKIVIDFSKLIPWTNVFIQGTVVTIVLSLITVILGSLLGLTAAMMKRSRYRVLNVIADLYAQIIRGTPMLVQLLIWLYALPQIGIRLPELPFLGSIYGSREFITAVVALAINSGAYISELLRGGLNSIDKGQMEAGLSLGLSRSQSMRKIIIPQAVKVILPGLANEFITMIKESAIVSTVGIFDVTYSSNIIKAATYSTFEPLLVVALIYLFLTTVTTQLMAIMERKLNTDADHK
ncbi:amino acid ABC transporter permease [Proteiniclasticum sp. QWL-01]|uniref:amino acid ABC transporter permease n=1 Tax=Proteiniclasticum sp. QWL-01 TaxID=3036945 RepID=UPI0021FD2AE9|nr:amino acid ABC transporter permease [Proteiniclasticum sp. QWL-01]UUM11354.1 amino acid ABC transporter permease [Clostridiaceae bacterium HFYG-1003]WFF72749.1 amino acid ABC transporter permease [Proteiniclasticum sp. QWL-01]